MNGRRAKAMRRAIYGSEYSPRARLYRRLQDGMLVALGRRRAYQADKREWKRRQRGQWVDDQSTREVGS